MKPFNLILRRSDFTVNKAGQSMFDTILCLTRCSRSDPLAALDDIRLTVTDVCDPDPPTPKAEIIIEISGGVLTNVSGLPDGWSYRLVDYDNIACGDPDRPTPKAANGESPGGIEIYGGRFLHHVLAKRPPKREAQPIREEQDKSESIPEDEPEDLRDFSEYIAAGGVACPYCRTEDIEGDHVEIDVSIARQPVRCNNPECGHAWDDIYTLTSVEVER